MSSIEVDGQFIPGLAKITIMEVYYHRNGIIEIKGMAERASRPCAYCQILFIPKRSHNIYCSNSHKTLAYRKRKYAAD